MFQFFNLLPTMNVRENVSLPLLLQGVSPAESEKRAAEVIGLVGLADRADHFVHQLSGGEQQRTAIARALVHRSAAIADEPTEISTRVPPRRSWVLEKISRDALTTLIVVTHSDEVARAASRRIKMRDGKIVRDSQSEGVRPLLDCHRKPRYLNAQPRPDPAFWNSKTSKPSSI